MADEDGSFEVRVLCYVRTPDISVTTFSHQQGTGDTKVCSLLAPTLYQLYQHYWKNITLLHRKHSKNWMLYLLLHYDTLSNVSCTQQHTPFEGWLSCQVSSQTLGMSNSIIKRESFRVFVVPIICKQAKNTLWGLLKWTPQASLFHPAFLTMISAVSMCSWVSASLHKEDSWVEFS